MAWLNQGLTPRQLAITLALGFAIGCIPLLGITTAICTLLALVFGLNLPAIQAANWVAMPLQVVLLIPFLRLGQWLFAATPVVLDRAVLMARIEASPWQALVQMNSIFVHALLAWLITATPLFAVLAILLTLVLSRMSWLTNKESNRNYSADEQEILFI